VKPDAAKKMTTLEALSTYKISVETTELWGSASLFTKGE